MINVGIIGAGLSAKIFHLSFLNTLKNTYNVIAMSTSDPKKIETFVDDSVVFYSTAEEIIKHNEIDLVVITAPNEVHYQYTKLALNHHKHVVVEKPIVESVAQSIELYDLAEKKNLLLTTYQNRRWDGDFLTVASLLTEKRLGELKYFESCFHKCVPKIRDRWREKPGVASGFWFDLGSHIVDQVIYLFGLPNAVTGRCLSMREKSQTTDYAHVILHYSDKEVVLKVNPFVASPMNRFSLHGTSGSYLKSHLDVQESQLVDLNMSVKDPQFGKETADRYGIFYNGEREEKIPTKKGNYTNLYMQLAHSIQHNKPSPISPTEVIHSLYILNLAVQSSDKKKTLPVTAM